MGVISNSPATRLVLDTARERREVGVTRVVELFGGEMGFLVFVPLFVGERFDGYMTGTFWIQQLLEPFLADRALLGYSITLFEGEEEIVNRSETSSKDHPEWLQEMEVEIRNVTWRVQVWPRPELIAKMRSWLPEATLAVGFLLALLMSLTIRLAQSARLRSREVGLANRELEAQITDRKRAEEVLRQSEERFRNLLESAPDAIVGTREDDRIMLVNAQTELLFGYSRDELLGQPVEMLLPEQFREQHGQHRANYNANSRMRSMGGGLTLAGRRKDGSEFPVEISLSPTQKDSGGGVTSIIRDITRRERAEETLRASEERYSLAVRGTSDGLWDWNIKSGEEYFSPRWKEMLGYQDHELKGHYKEWFDRIHPEDRSRVMRCLDDYLADQSHPFDLEHRLLHKDGTYRWFWTRGICLRDAEGKPYRMAGSITDITGSKQAEQALRESEDRFRAQYKGIPIPTYSWRLTGEDFSLMEYNDAALDLSRGAVADFIGITARKFFSDRPDIIESMWRCYRERKSHREETVLRMRTTGETKPFAFTRTFIPPDLVMVHAEDLTERKRAEDALRQKEEQLRQAQKMEAIGQLAGGVAHDFNNLLTGIIGYSGILMDKLGPAHPLLTKAEQIKKAGEQAASLTNQLLAFSRKQVLQPQIIDLNDIITDMNEMLRLLIGEDIDLVTDLGTELGKTKADPAQIKQIILNLASNARGAMPKGGRLIITTDNVERKQTDDYPNLGAQDRQQVMLTVSDTGSGMDTETLSHIFEPFFTTKEPGKGTGLGLASVYGVVQQSGGHIQVSSTPGHGTKFHIYFPRVSGTVRQQKLPVEVRESFSGSETVLLVEDADVVRELAKEGLAEEGYTVLDARNPAEAIRICSQKQTIHLLLTDVVMPGMSGSELAQLLTAQHKDLKVLYTSGYASHSLVHHDLPKQELAFISKPFALKALQRKVREVLDAPKTAMRKRDKQSISPGKKPPSGRRPHL